jgi:hypothetical protein
MVHQAPASGRSIRYPSRVHSVDATVATDGTVAPAAAAHHPFAARAGWR